jgi:hypothetical protein
MEEAVDFWSCEYDLLVHLQVFINTQADFMDSHCYVLHLFFYVCLVAVLCLPAEILEQYLIDEASHYACTVRKPVLDRTQ